MTAHVLQEVFHAEEERLHKKRESHERHHAAHNGCTAITTTSACGHHSPPLSPPIKDRVLALLPEPVQAVGGKWLQEWKESQARRAAAAAAEKAKRKADLLKSHARSLMRERKTRYSPLNGWEVAFFKTKFHEADLDADGFMTLEEVQYLLLKLDEEPKTMETWDLIEANTSRLDLISMHEFLVFLSIKRGEDATVAKRGAAQALREDQLARKKKNVEAAFKLRRQRLFNTWRTQLDKMRVFLLRVNDKEKLPPLGNFAIDALGEERARWMQRILHARWFQILDIVVITASCIILTGQIDKMVRDLRLKGGAPTISGEKLIPGALIATADTLFLTLSCGQMLVKVMTSGRYYFITQPWNLLDLVCVFFSLLKVVATAWARTLNAFASLRAFMLLSRITELRHLTHSILRSIPNMLVSVVACAVIWIMFAVVRPPPRLKFINCVRKDGAAPMITLEPLAPRIHTAHSHRAPALTLPFLVDVCTAHINPPLLSSCFGSLVLRSSAASRANAPTSTPPPAPPVVGSPRVRLSTPIRPIAVSPWCRCRCQPAWCLV